METTTMMMNLIHKDAVVEFFTFLQEMSVIVVNVINMRKKKRKKNRKQLR